MRPKASTAWATAALTAISLETSHGQAMACPPKRRISSAVFSSPASFTSIRKSFAPSIARRTAARPPMPEAAPVTSATLSLHFMGPFDLLFCMSIQQICSHGKARRAAG